MRWQIYVNLRTVAPQGSYLNSESDGPSQCGIVLLKRRRTRCPREWNYVAYVSHAGGVDEGALEAEAEAGVGDGAIFAQVAVPPVIVLL